MNMRFSPLSRNLLRLICTGLHSGSPEDCTTLASVEINTNVTKSSLDRLMPNDTVDVLICNALDASFTELMPKEHARQLIYQVVVRALNDVVYVAFLESGVLFTAIVYCRQRILNVCQGDLFNVVSLARSWL